MGKIADRWFFAKDPQLEDFKKTILKWANGNISESNLSLSSSSTSAYAIGWAHVFGETPTPAVDGSVTDFHVKMPYVRKSLRVRLMGVDQVRDVAGITLDYSETGDTTFKMTAAPASDMYLRVDYLRRSAVSGSKEVVNVIIPPQPPEPLPLDDYTKLLLHCNGADEQTNFFDSSTINPKTITANGSAQIDTAQYKFGGSSLKTATTGDYLSIPNSTDFNFGAGDFTIDCWIRVDDISAGLGNRLIVTKWGSGGNTSWRLWWESAGTPELFLYLNTDGAWAQDRTRWACTLTQDQWHHIAVLRDGILLRAFLDGSALTPQFAVQEQIGTHIIKDSTAQVEVCSQVGGTQPPVNGNVDELRVSKGIARWTANFTPPTEEYDT